MKAGSKAAVGDGGGESERVDFRSLQRAGYTGSGSLFDTDMYKRAGSAAPGSHGSVLGVPHLIAAMKQMLPILVREEKGTQTQTFWSGYLRMGWGSST